MAFPIFDQKRIFYWMWGGSSNVSVSPVRYGGCDDKDDSISIRDIRPYSFSNHASAAFIACYGILFSKVLVRYDVGTPLLRVQHDTRVCHQPRILVRGSVDTEKNHRRVASYYIDWSTTILNDQHLSNLFASILQLRPCCPYHRYRRRRIPSTMTEILDRKQSIPN